MRILNLEQGRPDRLTARRLLLSGRNRRRSGDREVKLIHGYGSHGVGGSIRRDTRSALQQLQVEGKILVFIPGEEFGPFSELCRQALTKNWNWPVTPTMPEATVESPLTLKIIKKPWTSICFLESRGFFDSVNGE